VCAQYIGSQFSLVKTCDQFIPLPVYATIPITGLVTGVPSASAVLATSLDCMSKPPLTCSAGIYSISTSKASAGGANFMPSVPNSLLFDLAGDKAYVGSEFGAVSLNPANLNSNNSAFTPLGAVTGTVLAVSANGGTAIFSDAVHNPNQVFIVGSGSPLALNISQASTAQFSPDGLKAFIFGFDSNQNPTLYVYSPLQPLQAIPQPPQTTVSSIAFSDNGAFVYVVQPNLGGVGPAVSVYDTCNNQLATDPGGNLQNIPLSAPPVAFKPLEDGVHFVALGNNGSLDYITATVKGITAATPALPAASICPMTVAHTVLKISLQQGLIHPINVFASADGTLLYVAASDRSSILTYDFGTGGVTGILLAGNATPVSADMTVDASTIMVAGSDGQLHEVSTAVGGSDVVQVPFPNLPNYLNPFCTYAPAGIPCKFDLMAVRP
jgi:hypothetical protein